MLKAIQQVIRIVLEEAGRRRWVYALQVFLAFISVIGLSIITLDPLIRWLFPSSAVGAWMIIVTLVVVMALLVTINFMRTFHERTLAETRAEWDRRDPILKKLYALGVRGNQLQHHCEELSSKGEPLTDEDQRQVRVWHQEAAGHLERRLGLEYRRRFYEHSSTGEAAPTRSGDCSVWISTRLQKLSEVVRELRLPPPRLFSEVELEQYEKVGYLTGRIYDDD